MPFRSAGRRARANGTVAWSKDVIARGGTPGGAPYSRTYQKFRSTFIAAQTYRQIQVKSGPALWARGWTSDRDAISQEHPFSLEVGRRHCP